MDVETFLQQDLTRRRFLERTAAGVVAGVGTVSTADESAVGGDRGRFQLGVIGLGRRGLELALALARFPDAEIAAICDPDGDARRQAVDQLAPLQARVPRVVSDSRRLLDSGRLDAVVIATPDQTHAALAVAACEAGLDVYLEAPTTHTLGEAQALRHAAAGRIVQCGLQQRSGEHFQSAIALLRAGGIGRIGHVRAWGVHRRPGAETLAQADSLPRRSGLERPGERDLAPLRTGGGGTRGSTLAASRQRRHWRWYWDSGSGELGYLGVHLLDVARWGLGVGLPQRVTAQGRILQTTLPFETPDTLSVQFDYPEATITWEHRLWSDYGLEGRSAGVAFHGTEGTLVVDRGGWKVYGRRDGPSAQASPLLEPHLRNFLDCLRTREAPAADLDTGCLSSALCHLGNLAYRQGREVVVAVEPAADDRSGEPGELA